MPEPITFTPLPEQPGLFACDLCGCVIAADGSTDWMATHATWHGLLALALRERDA